MFNRFHREPSLKQASFRLTEEGRQKLQMCFDGNEVGRVLVALECESASMDLDDIASATRIPKGRLEHLLPSIIRKGYVSSGGQGAGGEQ